MRFLKESWFPILLGVVTLVMLLVSTLPVGTLRIKGTSAIPTFSENEEWVAPSEDDIPPGTEGDMIRYGKDLIVNTAKYLGPKGIVGNMSNGMNCQNCHINAGRQNWANPFSAVEPVRERDEPGGDWLMGCNVKSAISPCRWEHQLLLHRSRRATPGTEAMRPILPCP